MILYFHDIFNQLFFLIKFYFILNKAIIHTAAENGVFEVIQYLLTLENIDVNNKGIYQLIYF